MPGSCLTVLSECPPTVRKLRVGIEYRVGAAGDHHRLLGPRRDRLVGRLHRDPVQQAAFEVDEPAREISTAMG